MAAVTVNQLCATYAPGVEMVNITANNGDTYDAQKIGAIWFGQFQPNRVTAASDSWSVTFTNGGTRATINLVGTTTSVSGSLLLSNS